MKLAIGTAQFGLDYGIANCAGQLTQEQASKVISLARAEGLDLIDTAVAYGSSEQALGNLGVGDFQVVTKLPKRDPAQRNLRYWAVDQVALSLQRLRLDSIYAVLLHSSEDLIGPDGQSLIDGLSMIKDRGWCKKIGVSIYRPNQLDDIWPYFQPDIVQSPYSILDRRLETSGWASRLKSENVELHVRSIFLQGLLLMPPDGIPTRFSNWNPELEAITDWAQREGVTQAEASIGCALALNSADRVIVGVDGVNQLEELIKASKRGALSVPMELACQDERLVDPTQW